jgi:TPR repeat protein
MISSVTAILANLIKSLSQPRHSCRDVHGPWDAFLEGRTAEGRGDTQEAIRLYLDAARDGLPVGATFVWLAYYLGDGVLADPIAAHAWARRATALGWPEGVLEPGVGEDGHGNGPASPPW